MKTTARNVVAILASLLSLALLTITSAQQPTEKMWLEPAESLIAKASTLKSPVTNNHDSAENAASRNEWYPSAIAVVRGRIQSFDHASLKFIRIGDEKIESARSDRVIWIESSDASKTEQAAWKLYRAGEHDNALRAMISAVQERPPVWRQQQLSMAAAQSALQSGRRAVAMELVHQLSQRSLPPLVVGMLPIQWQSPPNRTTNRTTALAQINSDNAMVRLVAASWLIGSPEHDQAVTAVTELKSDRSLPVNLSTLAALLETRMANPESIKRTHMRLLQKLEALPLCLQTGPTKCLAERFAVAGLATEAKRLELSLKLTPLRP